MSKEVVVPEEMQSATVEVEEAEAEAGTPEAVTSLRLKPLWDFVVIFPDTEKKYQGKVQLLDDSAAHIRKVKFRGLVVAAGPDCQAVKKGQYVYFWKHAGSIQFIEGRQFRVCRENEVFAIDERSQEEADAEDELGVGDVEGSEKTAQERTQAAQDTAEAQADQAAREVHEAAREEFGEEAG